MKVFHYSRILVAFILIGLVASIVIGMERHQVEVRNKTVDLAIDYEDVVRLAEMEGRPVSEVLGYMKEDGITSLAVYETTFKKLNENGKAVATPGAELLKNYQNGGITDPAWRSFIESGRVKGTEVYVTGHDMGTFREVKEDLLRRLGSDRVESIMVGSTEVLAVKANYKELLKMNLGMPTDEMRAVNEAGFYVLARPSNYLNASADDVRAVFARMEGFDISEVVFSGKEMLGAPKSLQTTIDMMKERNLTLGLIEATTQLQFYKQTGLEDISKNLGYDKIARLYSIPKNEQPKLKIDTAVERWSNTDQERNIRIDLMRMYDKPAPSMTLLETNRKYISDTRTKLLSKGYVLGKAGTFENYYPSKLLRAAIMPGVAAAAVLYLSLVIPALNKRRRLQLGLFVVLALCCAVPVLMGNGNKIRVLAALASANLFPALAVIWQLDRIRSLAVDKSASIFKVVVTGFIALIVMGVLSAFGAAYLSGALADTEYLLEFHVFRGIKLTFVLPIILVAIAFLQRYDIFDGRMDNTEGVMAQLKRILDAPIKLKSFIAILVVLAAAVVFVARSGHTSGMPVPQIELKFRAFLEQAFYARPRSKELLIGHPAFMIAAMAFWRKWPTVVFFILVLVATIGQGSMVETFAHMRTPVYMSMMRGIGGIVMGGAIGAVLMVLIHIWEIILQKAKGRSEAA